MKALALRRGELVVTDLPEPRMGPGQMLVRPLSTGICGSDLSAWQHTDEFLQASVDSDTEIFIFDKNRDLVMGHEFTSEVIEVADDVHNYQPGDRIVTMPTATDPAGVRHCVGYATDYPGALAERVVVDAVGTHRSHPHIPDGFSPHLAALTEPLTVGFNAVARSRISDDEGAIVIGCGPVGLGALVGLQERGVNPVIVSDPSPLRRSIAAAHGALVVDPADTDPVQAWKDATGGTKRLLVFECSGVKGMLNRLLYSVPHSTSILVSGSCMVDDTIRPVVGIYKNVRIDFCMGPDPVLGPTEQDEFFLTLDRLARGAIDAERLVTGWASLDAAAEAFALLRPGDPQSIEHFKILVRHDLEGHQIQPGPRSAEKS